MTPSENSDRNRTLYWYGDTSRNFNGELRHLVCNHAKFGNWSELLDLLEDSHDPTALVNTTRPDGRALFAPLHHAAWNGAPVEVVLRLVDLGAWRTLRCSKQRRPYEIAEQHGHKHLLAALTPRLEYEIAPWEIKMLQIYFHAVINGRADHLVRKHKLRLPELEPMLEFRNTKFWFTVPGMAGGFHYWIEDRSDDKMTLVTESWCRVVGGSGERHEITATGLNLVKSGFAY